VQDGNEYLPGAFQLRVDLLVARALDAAVEKGPQARDDREERQAVPQLDSPGE
jgi:hypothetical protein